MRYEGSTRTGTRTQDQLIKSQLLYQLSYPRLHFRLRGAGRIEAGLKIGKLIITKIFGIVEIPSACDLHDFYLLRGTGRCLDQQAVFEEGLERE